MRAEKVLALARAQIGVTEQPAGSNRVKYNTAYYGREVSGAGYPWCCTFVWWLFRQAGAEKLFYGGGHDMCRAVTDGFQRIVAHNIFLRKIGFKILI